MTKKMAPYSNLKRLSILGLICVLLVSLMVVACEEEEEEVTYTLTIAVSPTGGGTTSPAAGTHTYDEGASVTIIATAASGYVFDKWSGASTATTATTTVTMTSNKTVTANFEEEAPAVTEYTLTMAKVGNGTITPAAGTSTHDEGDVVTVTADPDTCYEFDGWTPVAAVADATAASTTVTMDADKTVTANFSLITYTLTMAKVGNGTITPDVGDHTEDCGDVVDITATPAGDSKFVDWTGDVADADSASTTVTMDAAKTVTANFALLQNVTLTTAVDGNGTVTPAAGDHTYVELTVVDITATPGTGMEFISWTGDGVADPSSATTTVTVPIGGGTVTATFAQPPPTLSVGTTWVYDVTYDGTANPQYTMTVTADDETVDTTDCYLIAGTWAGDATPDRVAGGYEVTVEGEEVWLSKTTLDRVKAHSVVWALGGTMEVETTTTYTHTGSHGWPFSDGQTWSYNAEAAGYATETHTYDVLVTAETINVGGTDYDCLRIDHTVAASPSKIVGTLERQEWLCEDVNGFVKIVNDSYDDTEVFELASYTPA